MATLFISDLHLESRRPETTRLLLDLLEGRARHAAAFYILGDLFEAWIGDDAPCDPGPEVARALNGLSRSGVPVYFMPGNRDFLVGPAFCAAAGMTLLSDPVVHTIEGHPTLLLHGDTLCTDDVAYQRFRRRVQNPRWRRRLLALPVPVRRAMAAWARWRSRRHTARSPAAIMDVNAGAVAATFRRAGVTRMIHGHTHRPAIHHHVMEGVTRERIVLGDWDSRGSLLVVDTEGARLSQLP